MNAQKKTKMATYKKRGAKKSQATPNQPLVDQDSTTAEVFETLDVTASKTEAWVGKYQNIILTLIGVIAVGVLGYLGYNRYVVEPKAEEAVSELNQAQYYFELAMNSVQSDSLFLRALNGGEGKYGFLDIIDNYKGTPAATLATYGAGMSYLHLKQYENAITYLDKFNADDILLSALSKGAIGDAFAEIGQLEDAYDYYMKAAATNNNLFSTPKYLFKAAMVGADLGKTKQALALLERIKNEFPQSPEMSMVEVQIGRLETLNQ